MEQVWTASALRVFGEREERVQPEIRREVTDSTGRQPGEGVWVRNLTSNLDKICNSKHNWGCSYRVKVLFTRIVQQCTVKVPLVAEHLSALPAYAVSALPETLVLQKLTGLA